ncbi:serine/threonine-protein kinase [Polyangium sorediatum]|uniref:non-specific serine/threonine protein kinase n=1 Tax=Polyangium sorediatum TaxID=889274 RepID=A0ABT6NZR4_9BACT|nr:serine/threonine-protein kinase [Polyangium sorediatum]MDI1433794.1 serine/threonine-protein kinase [Polyangium sorediatum]
MDRRSRTAAPLSARWPFPASRASSRGSLPERLPMGAGGYELVAQLGSGGMAEVFLARRRGLYATEHTVVVKRLRDEFRAAPAVVKMFAWEAWISARLRHPNIVRFYDFVSHRGRDHLVLEHVRGPDLATLGRALQATGRSFSFGVVIEVGAAAARALAHAHALKDDDGVPIGLVHRDVSPQNILVSVDGEIKLIDFGVAKTTSAHVPRDTAPGLVKGKMGYIAPEHLRGQPLDARGDVYALGVVLFEMLTGRPLFRRGADVEMIRQALDAEIPPLAALRWDCPPALEAVVQRALAQDPRDRFESAAAMEQALRAAGSALSVEGGPAALAELAELAREVYEGEQVSAPDTWREPMAPPLVTSPARSAPIEEPPAEDTRPEGVRRARILTREPGEIVAATSARCDATRPEVPLQVDEAATIVAAPPLLRHRAFSPRIVPLVVAFVMGLLVAAAARGSTPPEGVDRARDAAPGSRTMHRTSQIDLDGNASCTNE